MPTAIRARLDLPPAEAVKYFAAKGETLSWDYTDVWREAHTHAFTVAKVTSLEILRTIRVEVEKAIGAGQTFESFRRTLTPRLQDLGWWGRQEVVDADTGEVTQVQLGSLRRLRTIYQTNVQTAYMAGRYQRLLANVADRPYWRYVAVMDSRTRPAHAALNGRVWRWDDPIWQILWPPNGWGCRCRVVALTEAEFKALSVPLESSAGYIAEREVQINKNGDVVTVKGLRYQDAAGRDAVFFPDPGWDYNPGAAGAWDQELSRLAARKQRAADRVTAAIGPAEPPKVPETIDEFVSVGRAIAATLPDADATPTACRAALIERLRRDVGIDTACQVASRGPGANLVRVASRLFPDSWTAAADTMGPLYVKSKKNGRGWQYTELRDPLYAGARLRVPDFGTVQWQKGAGYLMVPTGNVNVAVHEFAHRLQAALPALDNIFVDLHRRRTAGDPLERLRDITGHPYAADEVCRKDKYVKPYQGKEYDGQPMEVMTMAFESLLGDRIDDFRSLYTFDREMFELLVGLLFHWRP